MPAAKYRGMYPQYPKAKNYRNLGYRVSSARAIDLLYYGLTLVLKTEPISQEDFNTVLKELERIKQLKLQRAEYKAANLRTRARRKLQRANSIGNEWPSRVDTTDDCNTKS